MGTLEKEIGLGNGSIRRWNEKTPGKVLKHKDNGWNDFDRIVLHTKAMIQVPKSQYQPNQVYKDVFMRNPYNETNTQNITIGLLSHTGYEGPIPVIKYISSDKLSMHAVYKK